MTNQPPQLDYAPHPLPWHRRKRVRRLIVLVILAVAAMSLAWWQGRTALTSAQVVYWKHQCMTYTAPPDRVVFDENPAGGWITTNAPMGYHGGYVVDMPTCLENFLHAKKYEHTYPPLFVHGRASPHRELRLTSVIFGGFSHTTGCWGFYSRTYGQNGEAKDVATLEIQQEKIHPLRLFAGQPDSSDPSHFTIGYEVDGEKGTIDGWLQDDDTVKMQVRDGPVKKP